MSTLGERFRAWQTERRQRSECRRAGHDWQESGYGNNPCGTTRRCRRCGQEAGPWFSHDWGPWTPWAHIPRQSHRHCRRCKTVDVRYHPDDVDEA